MNEEKYSKAHDLVSNWSVWHDDKLLVLSVIGRARHLEKEVERLDIRMVDAQQQATKAWSEVEELREKLKKIEKAYGGSLDDMDEALVEVFGS